MEILLRSNDQQTLMLVITDDIETREVLDLSGLERFVQDRAADLNLEQAHRIGMAAAIFASLDTSVVWSRDVASLGKLVDAYDFATGFPALSEAFGHGLNDGLAYVKRLGHRPDRTDIASLIDPSSEA